MAPTTVRCQINTRGAVWLLLAKTFSSGSFRSLLPSLLDLDERFRFRSRPHGNAYQCRALSRAPEKLQFPEGFAGARPSWETSAAGPRAALGRDAELRGSDGAAALARRQVPAERRLGGRRRLPRLRARPAERQRAGGPGAAEGPRSVAPGRGGVDRIRGLAASSNTKNRIFYLQLLEYRCSDCYSCSFRSPDKGL